VTQDPRWPAAETIRAEIIAALTAARKRRRAAMDEDKASREALDGVINAARQAKVMTVKEIADLAGVPRTAPYKRRST
jgi:hypothetical protein